MALELPLDRARPLPASVYLDPEVLAFERATIFRERWLSAGREADAVVPGAFFRPPHTDDIIVVRGADLALRAFFNVCRHRASLLTCDLQGRIARFECPYHGWTYELDGRLRAAPHAPRHLDTSSAGLLPLALRTGNGFVFCRAKADDVSEADGTGKQPNELDDPWAGAPPWLRDTELRHVVRAHRSEWVTAANWKLLVENFQESHHFTRVHRGLEQLTPNDGARSWLTDSPWMGGVMPLADDAETVSTTGLRRTRPFIVPEPLRRAVHDAVLFPTLLTSLQPDYLLTYRLVPERVDRTRVVFDIFVHPEAARGAPSDPADTSGLDEVVSFWAQVNAEDRAICEGQQRGMAAPGYRPLCFATVEDGVFSFQRKVAAAYAGATKS